MMTWQEVFDNKVSHPLLTGGQRIRDWQHAIDYALIRKAVEAKRDVAHMTGVDVRTVTTQLTVDQIDYIMKIKPEILKREMMSRGDGREDIGKMLI